MIMISGRAFQRLGACEPECSLTMPLGFHIFGLGNSKERYLVVERRGTIRIVISGQDQRDRVVVFFLTERKVVDSNLCPMRLSMGSQCRCFRTGVM